MITHVIGRLVEKNESYLVIDCNGIGYFIHISSYTYSFLSKIGTIVNIYTYLFIKENKHILYGFFDKKERKIFSYLISVNGVGGSLAIILLSYLTPYEIEKSIYQENIKTFNKIKGIGIKTAKKIIIELKDKIYKELKINNSENNDINNIFIKKKALNAIKVLGFTTKKIYKEIIDDILTKNPNSSVEDLVKEFLKRK